MIKDYNMDKNSISICISTKNREKILVQTLRNLFFVSDIENFTYEVIITNDGDVTLNNIIDEFRDKKIKLIPNKRRQGLAGGRNNGIDHSSCDLVLFLDDDILLPNNFFSKIFYIHNHYSSIILGCDRCYSDDIIALAEKSSFGRYKLKHEYRWLDGVRLEPLENDLYIADMLAGFAISLTKDVINKVGYFNENFEYAGCEDAEFFNRAKKNNINLILDKSIVCFHNELDLFDLRKWLTRQSQGIRSAVVMCYFHPEGKKHPTWFTNTPLKFNESWWVKKLKIKKTLISWIPIKLFIYILVQVCEKLNFPDKFLFKLYNSLWLAETYRSFREVYKIFKRQNKI